MAGTRYLSDSRFLNDRLLFFLSQPRVLFTLAFVIRIAVIPLSALRINPYATSDVFGFAAAASAIASNLASGSLSLATPETLTREIWGAFLSPFFLIPGLGWLLAHLFVAALGAAAVYNVAVLARYFGQPRAVFVAATPLTVYPSIVFVQSTLLREGAILFALTTIVRLLIVSPEHLGRISRALAILVALGMATVLRPENALLYILSSVAAIAAYFWDHTSAKVVAVVGSTIMILIGFRYFRLALSYFNQLRESRARGRTAYLGDVQFQSILDAIGFSVIGIVYFFFTPFPWMIGTPADLLIMGEGITNMLYVAVSSAGFIVVFGRNRPAAVGLVVFLVVGVVVYGLATANVGTAVRHRQMFLWVVFLFGGIGTDAVLSRHGIQVLSSWARTRA